MQNQAGSNDRDSSDSSSSSSSSVESSALQQLDIGETDVLVVARITKIQQMMLVSNDSYQPVWEDWLFRAACGTRFPRDACVSDTQLDPQLAMCRHAACFKRWQHVGAMNL